MTLNLQWNQSASLGNNQLGYRHSETDHWVHPGIELRQVEATEGQESLRGMGVEKYGAEKGV